MGDRIKSLQANNSTLRRYIQVFIDMAVLARDEFYQKHPELGGSFAMFVKQIQQALASTADVAEKGHQA